MNVGTLLRKGGLVCLKLALKFLLFSLWYLPSKFYGTWIVFGFYVGSLGAFGVWLELIALTDFLWYAGSWAYHARWRWNWVKLHKGIRPLFERRDDL